jgi:hypothetical protein
LVPGFGILRVKLIAMPRSKKGAGQPPANQNPPDAEAHDAAENEGMAHVGADALAGSPDIFAAKKAVVPSSPEPAPLSSGEQDVIAEPAPITPEPEVEPVPIATMEPAPSFSSAPPATVEAHRAPARRSGTGLALGVVLVVVGIFYLVVQVAGIDLSTFGWPLFVIIAGLTLLIVGFASLGTGAAIPGGILTMVGLILAYQNSTGHWTSWAYAWALVAPGGVGLGLFLQGLRERNIGLIRQGRSLMFIALLIFMVGFVFFESIFNISGINDLPVVKAALPALFLLIGLLLLARSIQNSRRA